MIRFLFSQRLSTKSGVPSILEQKLSELSSQSSSSNIDAFYSQESVQKPFAYRHAPGKSPVKDIRLELPSFSILPTAETKPETYLAELSQHRAQIQERMKLTLRELIDNNQPTREQMRTSSQNGTMLPSQHHPALPAGMHCVFIRAGRNNTIMTLTNSAFQSKRVVSGGTCGLKGYLRGTPECGTRVAAKISAAALEHGVKDICVVLKGFGPGREQAFRTLASSGLMIRKIEERTGIRHGGTKPVKVRRV